MQKKIQKNHIFLISSLFLLIFISSCKTTSSLDATNHSKGTRIKKEYYETLDEEPFYVQNKELFVEKKLSNGIPLYVKKSRNQKKCSVAFIIATENTKLLTNKTGLEQVTLEALKLGTEKYSANYIASLAYTDNAEIWTKTHADYLEYGVELPKISVENVIPVFAETFAEPAFPDTDFEVLLDELSRKAKEMENNSGYNLIHNVNQYLNSKDSYFSILDYNPESFITLKDVKNYHDFMLNSKKISVLASGNFSDEDIQFLQKALESQLSKIDTRRYFEKTPSVSFSTLSENQKTPVEYTAQAGQKNCVTGLFSIPSISSDEYISYALLSLFLDDFIYSQIKDKYNYASDAGTGVIISRLPFGVISLYDVTGSININDSVGSLAESSFSVEQLQQKLNTYKSIYNSFVVSSELSSQKTVSQMAVSLVYCNDVRDYIKRPFKIHKIKAEDLRAVYDYYIKKGIIWFRQFSE